jgi:acyl-homoserine-lactone acylase
VPYAQLAQLERTDYVFNANDSHWLTHPDELLTGFSPLQGAEEVPQTPRTRTNVMLLSESAEPWSIDDVEAAIFSDRSVLAETLREPLVDACTATYTLDASGAVLFREWLRQFDDVDDEDAGALYADGFDPARPGSTPAVAVEDRTAWLTNLASAAQVLDFVGIPLDAALRGYQWEVRSGEQIPIHGGTNSDGVANIVDCCSERSSLMPGPDTGERLNDRTTLAQIDDVGIGYPVERGASFVMALQFGPDGPVAEGFLTYGNPDDPTDRASRAGLEAFSAGEWAPLAFTEADVNAVTETVTIVTG